MTCGDSIDLLNDAYAAVERALGACMNRQALDELLRAKDLLELAIAHVKELISAQNDAESGEAALGQNQESLPSPSVEHV
jgi:hypothetical protein